MKVDLATVRNTFAVDESWIRLLSSFLKKKVVVSYFHVVKKTALLKNCEQMQKKKTTDFNKESDLF